MTDAVQTQNDQSKFTPRVFSGIKPSGGLTLGNYLGAIKRFVDMQSAEFQSIYCVVDLHAITVWQNPTDLRQATYEVAAGYIASGIDPEKSILFNQSQVSQHAELGIGITAPYGSVFRSSTDLATLLHSAGRSNKENDDGYWHRQMV